MPKKHTFKAAFQNAGGRGEFLDHKNSEISKISEFCFIFTEFNSQANPSCGQVYPVSLHCRTHYLNIQHR